MIYITYKMLALLKNHLNCLFILFSNAFLKSIIDFYFYRKKYFFTTYNDGNLHSGRRKRN